MDAKEVWADKVDVRGDIGSDRMADDSIYISFFFFFFKLLLPKRRFLAN